MAAELAVATC